MSLPAAKACTPARPAGPVEPLLRWAGSKRSLLPQLTVRCPRGPSRYIEPFAGSACLFFALQPQEAVVSDRNDRLIETYRVLVDEPEEVAEQVHRWRVDSETYYRVRGLSETELPTVARAARFIYLNRLCFNGVYRTNRKGDFNVPYGLRPGAIPSADRFRACAEALSRAELRADDFEIVLAAAGSRDFIYVDPPYSRAASDAYGVYGYGSFTSTDLDRLISCLRRADAAGAKILLSYTWDARLRELGPSWRFREVSVRTQVGGRTGARTTRREVLAANYGHESGSRPAARAPILAAR